jgi:hypothetical protein
VIVDHDCGNSREQANGRRKKRLSNARCHHARFVVCNLEIPIKLFMMPQTVPNKPTNGAVAAIVASIPCQIEHDGPPTGRIRRNLPLRVL